MILATAQPFEPEGVAEVRAWFAETSRKAYAVGPLFPLGEGAAAGERLQSDKPSEIEQFLEATLESHGPKSLLYVCHSSSLFQYVRLIFCVCSQIAFGSLYWSTEPEKIWAFLDVVMEKKIPFVCRSKYILFSLY